MSISEFTSRVKESITEGAGNAVRKILRPSPKSHQPENWVKGGAEALPTVSRSDIQLSLSSESPRLHWTLTRVDVCRILSVAKDLHQQRVTRGEVAKDSPITIADVGAGSGHLMGVVIEEARKQNLKVRVAVIDPCNDSSSHKADSKEIEAFSEIRFFRENSVEFLQRLYAKNPEVRDLLKKREAIKPVARIAQELECFPDERDRREYKSFKNNLDIVNAELGTSFCVNDFADGQSYYNKTRPALVKAISQKFEGLSNQIEAILALRPAAIDLVVNAWMPSDRDFSCDIRALNGAGIVYVLKRSGCTGFQPQSDEGTKLPREWWMGTSYDNHGNYTNRVSWKGVSPAGVLAQSRNGYSINAQLLNNSAPNEDYPWIERQGPSAPVHELKPDEHYLEALGW